MLDLASLGNVYHTILQVLTTSLPGSGMMVVLAATTSGWGGKTVMLDYPVYDRAARFAKDRYGVSLRKFVNDYLGTALKKEELLEKKTISSYLGIVTVNGDEIFVKDDKLEDVVRIKYDRTINSLRCTRDGADTCVHVAYCLASYELGRLNIT